MIQYKKQSTKGFFIWLSTYHKGIILYDTKSSGDKVNLSFIPRSLGAIASFGPVMCGHAGPWCATQIHSVCCYKCCAVHADNYLQGMVIFLCNLEHGGKQDNVTSAMLHMISTE